MTYDNGDTNLSEIDYKLNALMVPILKSKGIDGYKYFNDFEGDNGGVRWVPLESYQIAPVAKFLK
jgi:hypothetical protein